MFNVKHESVLERTRYILETIMMVRTLLKYNFDGAPQGVQVLLETGLMKFLLKVYRATVASF